MIELIANLKAAMADRIKHNSWMSEATKTAALEKLAQDGRDGRLSRQVPRLWRAADRSQ